MKLLQGPYAGELYSKSSLIANWKSMSKVEIQGSVLGPILFNVLMNDLNNDIESTFINFTGDNKPERHFGGQA